MATESEEETPAAAPSVDAAVPEVEAPPPPPNKLHEWLAAAAIMMFLGLIAYMFWSFLNSARM